MNKNNHRTYIINYAMEIVDGLSKIDVPLQISITTLLGQLSTHLIENLDERGYSEELIRGHMENINNISLDNYFENKRHDD